MAHVRVLMVRAAGTNCDQEAQYAWESVGATVERMHIRRLLEEPLLLDACQIVTLPGGFSYGDDLGAGRILAAQIERGLSARLGAFVERGGLVLGICNGFQVLVKTGLLPFAHAAFRQVCTITYNEPPGFQDRWVWLTAGDTPCAFLEPGRTYELPIAHGEGRVAFANDTMLQQALAQQHVALRYAESPSGRNPTGQPANPNGSTHDIAGLCDATGRVLGLMPHPERFVTWTQHPAWTSRPWREAGDGLALFQRAIAHLS